MHNSGALYLRLYIVYNVYRIYKHYTIYRVYAAYCGNTLPYCVRGQHCRETGEPTRTAHIFARVYAPLYS